MAVTVAEASDPDGLVMNAQEQPMVLSFQRGDIDGDGDIDVIDAMYGSQYIVGSRPADDIWMQNMASVKHGGTGDIPDIIDCMFVAQYVVGFRNEYFELVR